MTSQTTAPAIIHKLVETFEQNLDSYRFSKNETELRRQFLDPFFTALGWDVANEKGYDELGKEVTHEFSVDVAGQQKKADYAFRVGRGEKFDFLVEAKKPSVKVETSQEAAFQIRRYGWSAKLPINILTDFEHFAVYDCRTKPNINDKASMGRIMLIHYKDFVSRWNEIVEIFSPEAVRKGSFAKYAEGMKGKKGTADVDDAFLEEIERWRELLAKNIALRNDDIDIAGLNYSVQMTIDRIVFLRICEERGIEPENQLLEITNTDKVYEELCELFKRADTKYNSGLFHFKNEKEVISRPDDLTLSLSIDDKVLKDIISNLYYPKSPYAFLYIPSDILGQVYERFLGKVIRLTAGHNAKVEEKPEVRKAGGVYYTPTYIVEYIVKNTVGKLVENKSPKDITSLKIIDPACGSGTFLLGAYQFLLDWHLNWYSENEPEKAEKNKAVVKIGDGYRLTTAKKKEILLNNIHGVDIDAQAVEVTKLSLLLKVLENASGQLGLGIERVLPDLGNNIKCGNSLIGFDYFEGQLFPNEEERASVNPFDWRNEFKDIFSKGGFDAVIGNPPYVRGRSLDTELKDFLLASMPTFTPNADLYIAFLSRGFDLLKSSGLISFIIPRSLLIETYAQKLRLKFLQSAKFIEIVDFQGIKVFEDATVTNVIVNIQKEIPSDVIPIRHWKEETHKLLMVEKIIKSRDNAIRPELTGHRADLVEKVNNTEIKVDDLCYVSYSVAAHSEVEGKKKDAYIFDQKKNAKCKQFIEAREISRYKIDYLGRWLEYDPKIVRRTGLPELFIAPKIMVRDVVGQQGLICAYDDSGFFADYSVVCLTLKSNLQNVTSRKLTWTSEEIDLSKEYSIFYILGIINSKLLNFFFKTSISGGLHVYPDNIRQLPIRAINFSNSDKKIQHDKIVNLVEQMLASQKSLAMAQTPQEKERLERQIEFTDKAIDSLVYELYGLTNEEIKIVEGE